MTKLVRLGPILFAVACLSGCSSSLLDDPGVSLPPAEPAQTYSTKAVALNEKANELLTIDVAQAADLYDQAIEEDPNFYPAYCNKATLLVDQDSFSDAITYFRRLAALRPQMAECYVGWAYCLNRTGQKRKARQRLRFAIAAYNERLRQQPNDPMTLLNRAVAAYVAGETETALKEVERVLTSHPDSEMAKHLLKAMRAPQKKNNRWTIIFD